MTGLKKNSEITNWSRSPIYLHNEEWYRGTDGTSRFSLSNRSNSAPDRYSYCRWSPCVTELNISLKFRNGGVFRNYSTTKGAMANWMVSFDSAHQIGLFPHWTDVLTIDEGDRPCNKPSVVLGRSTRTDGLLPAQKRLEKLSHFTSTVCRTDLARFTDAVLCWTNATNNVVACCMSFDDEDGEE